MARLRCVIGNLASLLLVFLISYVSSADPNVVEVSSVNGYKLLCPLNTTNDTLASWKGPDGTQLNYDNRTFADSRLSFVDDKDLQIADAVPRDNGIYTCVVGAEEAPVNLTIYVTTFPKVMMSFSDQIWDSSIGQYQIRANVDENKTVTCMITGAFPMPMVSMTIINHNGSVLTMIPEADITIESNQESDNTYSVNASITRELGIIDNNREVRCSAMFNVEGTQSTEDWSAKIYLIEVRPTIFVASGAATVSPGDDTLHYRCIVERGRPEVESIMFYLGGQEVAEPYNFTKTPMVCNLMQEPNQYYTNMFACHSNLTLQLTKMDNGKSLGCNIIYQNQTLQGLTDASAIDFRFPPTMVNITGNMPILVSGSTTTLLTLTCATDSSNGNATIRWYNGSTAIDSSEAVQYTASDYNGSSAMQNIQINVDRYMDGDVIRCEASNFYSAPKVMAEVTLNVSYSPEIIQPTANIYRVYSGERITIPCSAEAKPMADTKWMLVHSPTNKTEVTSVVRMANGNTLLDLQNVLLAYAGTYECQASNMVPPDSEKSVQLVVLDKTLLAPFSVITRVPSQTSVEFEFELPADRVIQALFLRYSAVDNQGQTIYFREIELTIPATGNTVSVTVGDLQPATTYEFQLREVDGTYGLVAHTTIQQVRTSDPDDEYTRSDINKAILISVFVTAAVVALICIIIFCLIRRGGCSSSSKGFDLQMKPRA